MNKKDFLIKVEKELKGFNSLEIKEIINYYDEIISDKVESNLTEEQAVSSLGEINIIIKEIKINALSKRENSNIPTSSFKNLLIILGICFSPILLPIGIAILAVYFAIFVSLIAVAFALGISGIAILVAFIVEGFRSLFTLKDLAAFFFQSGIGLLLGSILLILFIHALRLFRILLDNTNKFFINTIKNKLAKRGTKNV